MFDIFSDLLALIYFFILPFFKFILAYQQQNLTDF
jgi:hypothetical protein